MQAELSVTKKPETQECETFGGKIAKLPKLVISKFDGSFMDWPRFWGQFSEAIDKSSIALISKLTYLLELLEPKVKRSVEVLPFTPEGYNRAKAILKDKYGKEPEIVKCYVKEILDLPYVTSANPRKVAEFYDKLSHSVQALETMGKLNQISGNVSMTLEKLSGIRGDLVRTDNEWETWDFGKLTEALRQWVKRNPVPASTSEREETNRRKMFHTRDGDFKPRGCVYCGDLGHKATQCEKITDVKARKRILAKNGLCFNCATKKHRASDCSSKMSCSHCNKRHHSSICEVKNDKRQDNDGERKVMTDGVSGNGVFPVVIVKVNGIKCRALLDSGAGSSYVSAKMINALGIRPIDTKRQRIDMLMGSKTTQMEIYDAKISSIDGSFELDAKLTKVNKPELLSTKNPEYDNLIKRYQHLNAVRMDDYDSKDELPIHVILGVSEYARIKTSQKPLVGGPGEPVAEHTKFGWSIMSPGVEFDKGTMFLTQTTRADFEDLCRLDVLGLADTSENDQDTVYQDFKEQLQREPAGWYETKFPWKSNYPDLPTNEAGSRRRLDNLIKRLKRSGSYQRYDDIIRDQLKQGVIEPVPQKATEREFYILHKGVVKEEAESTKLRIVYDASARETNGQPSLNDCLNTGPVAESIMEHFSSLPISPNPSYRNPGGSLCRRFDDGGANVKEVGEKKIKAIEVFQNGTFKLHKSCSNVPELEGTNVNHDEEETYAKQNLGTTGSKAKLLGLPWNKPKNKLGVVIPKEEAATTKRTALSQLAKVYDPLGLVSPVTLVGKTLYREMCENHLAWDGELPEWMKRKWENWCRQMSERFEVPRTLAPFHQPTLAITLHAFGDASKVGVSAAVHAVVEQEQGTTQGLVCSKSRLAKKNLTIPRLELVAGHMATNLVTNVEAAVGVEKVTAVHCWLDSTVALYWINGQGEYRQFVANRVKKIREHERVIWHHVPTDQNPADLGSRGGDITSNKLWQHGPSWLSDKAKWPPEVVPESSPEVTEETRCIRSVQALQTSNPSQDEFDRLLETYRLRKVLRIGAWVQRFIYNCRSHHDNREYGPLETTEIEDQTIRWIKRAQREAENNGEVESVKLLLNLQPNDAGVLECRGRIAGEYPIFLPESSTFTRKIVEQSHLATLHGGVASTMARVRERYWVPKLRRTVKQVRSDCYGCVRFRSQAYQKPPPGKLPSTRTEGSALFQVLGVDFAGSIRYKSKAKAEKKAYLVLFMCSLTRAVHLEVLRSLEMSEFLPSFQRLIARRGCPEVIYSDNAATFKAANKWLNKAQTDEKFYAFLADRTIHWRFNLSRAPWWGGQFERLIGLFKRAFYKVIGNGTLSWEELAEVVLDVEVALNSRPLSYIEDDVELPVLTPNAMLNINPSVLPELKPHYIDDRVLRKRAKFMVKCKEAVWKRWSQEYVRELRERHVNGGGKQTITPRKGSAVIIKDESKNRNTWKLGVVTENIKGKDGIVRGAKVKTANGELERPIQHLYPLELSCDEDNFRKLDPTAPTFVPRPKRDAAAAARLRVEDIAENDELEQ